MRRNLLIPLALMALPFAAHAQSFEDLADATLLTGWRTAEGDHMAAIHITLRPGWVTYWRTPGDGGIPPQMVFEGSDSIESVTPYWPTPEVFGSYGMRSIGYYDSVTVPLAIDLNEGASDVAISGEITIGVCEEICIPVTLNVASLLPQVGQPDAMINAALADRPLSQEKASVGSVTCQISPLTDGLELTATINVPQAGRDEYVVVETADPRIWVSEADMTREGNVLTATVDLLHPTGRPFALDRQGVRMTVLGSDRAIDIQGCSAD